MALNPFRTEAQSHRHAHTVRFAGLWFGSVGFALLTAVALSVTCVLNRYDKGNRRDVELLVSYNCSYSLVKPEIRRILEIFGDPDPWIGKTAVLGIAVVNSCLDNREVIRRCRELRQDDVQHWFEFATKWVPVDYWCATDLPAIKDLIDSRIKPRIEQEQTWGMRVHRRRWQAYHTRDIIEFLAAGIDRKVNLENPDWIVWVDIVGRQTAVSLLRPQDIFSIRTEA